MKHAQYEGEEGVVTSPLDGGLNGHAQNSLLMDDTAAQLTFDPLDQGQGQDVVSPPSHDHVDSKYEFDPVSTGSSSAPLSPPETTDSSSGMFVDFDGVAKHVHEASTASVSPQSPENMSAEAFMSEDKENSDPMTSSMIAGDPMTSSMVVGDPMTSSMVGGDLMTSSFIGDFLPESSRAQEDRVCDYNVSGVIDGVGAASELPPGGPVSDAALQEIGVYGAPPPEENGALNNAPVNDLVCLDEDGMEMPTTQAPTAPPTNTALPSNAMSSNNPFSDSLINTQAPMGQFDPFKVNGAQSAAPNPFDSIPGQPPIGIAPSLQPKEAFVDPAPPLVPTVAPPVSPPSAPGGPDAIPPTPPSAEPDLPPPFGMPPRNEPLFEKQPLPDVANVMAAQGSSGGQDALLLEDVKMENGPSTASAPVVPPIDLSGFDPNPPEVKAEVVVSPKKQTSPTKKSPKESEAIPDSSKIPSPKKTKPSATSETKKAAPVKQTNARTATAAKKATVTNNKAPAKKVSPTSAAPAPAKAKTPVKPPAKTPSKTPTQSPRAPPTRPSPRQPVKKTSPRTKKGFHSFSFSLTTHLCNVVL